MAAQEARRERAAAAVPAHRARGRPQAHRAPMRLRIILLEVAISSMILVSFLVPLALLLRSFQADRAVSPATAAALYMAGLVDTLPTPPLETAVTRPYV